MAPRIALPFVILLVLAVALAPAAQAEPASAVAMRVGVHDGYGRLVFDLPQGQTGFLTQDGSAVTLRFTGAATPATPSSLPRNVQTIHVAEGTVALTVAPGVRVRTLRLPDRIVVDLLDPPGLAIPPVPQPRRAPRPHDILASRPEAAAAVPPVAQPGPTAAAPVVPVTAAPLSPEPATAATQPGQVRAGADDANGPTPAMLRLPFAVGTAAAAFRLGDEAVLVFDERRPIDVAGLRDDPIFAGLSVQLLQAGTLLRLKLPPGGGVSLARTSAGWNVTPQTQAGTVQPIAPASIEGGLLLPAAAPGGVLSVPNPLTGGILLVGTQRGPGQGVAVTRRNPMLTLLPTWQGVVIDPAADALVMRADQAGFVVTGDTPARPLPIAAADSDAAAMAAAMGATRRFDLPSLPGEALRWRLRAATMQAAVTPAQGRTRKRLLVAQTLLALGLGAEAQAVLAVIAADDPQAADDPDRVGLSAIAALVAGRPADADGLDDPRLSGSDEIALWRAVRAAMCAAASDTPGAAVPASAPVFAADLPLLLSYPAPLRDRLLPLAAETMAAGGEVGAATRLVAARPQDESLALAGAMVADRAARGGGDPEPALAAYDRLAAGHDRLLRLRAATAATELRLTTGRMTPGQAADAMERQLYAWRGDGREVASRLRLADLRRDAGQWRQGLALLREAAQIWPEREGPLHARLAAMFADALADDVAHPLPPLELVTLAEENADLLPDGVSGGEVGGESARQLAARLADRLVALDLPDRAVPALARLLAVAPPGPVRAEIGQRQAALQVQVGDVAGARATLSASEDADLPPPLRESRVLLAARIDAASGDLQAALTRLNALDTPAADEMRAQLLETARDWPGATAALRAYAARALPADGPFDAAQAQIVLRLASAAAQAADESTLARLRADATPRMPQGDTARLLAVLTSPPVRDAADLPRAARETTLARAVPDDLRTLTSARGRPMAAR